MFSPIEAYIAHSVAYFSDDDLIGWAVDYVGENEAWDDPDLIELTMLNRKQPRQVETACVLLKRSIQKQSPDFILSDRNAESQARHLFRLRLAAYLAEECKPYDVCRMVDPIEQLYDFPSWLGDMYNACDWIEPDTEPSGCRHLEQAIRETLQAV